MVSKESVESQLIRLGFNLRSRFNQSEIRELPNILMADEEIYECVNGYYEGGFALLVATNVRVLLIDKKPFNFLTVEDLRFDMINEMDYSHRMMGAQISISVGNKNLRFRSYNQPRLRKLISHVQHCIAESKKQQSNHQAGQNLHLEQINQQLQTYLLAQYQSQLDFNQRLREAQTQGAQAPLPQLPVVKPEPQLADFLYSQSLLRQHAGQLTDQAQGAQQPSAAPQSPEPAPSNSIAPPPEPPARQADASIGGPAAADAQLADLYAEGHREIFGHLNRPHLPSAESQAATPTQTPAPPPADESPAVDMPEFHIQNLPRSLGLEVNPLRIAYSKLPMALRNRKFGRPSFHAHSLAVNPTAAPITPMRPISPTQQPPALA